MAEAEKSLDVGSESAMEKPSRNWSPEDAEHGEVKTVQLKRRLQSRHLQMIAIGKYVSNDFSGRSLTNNHRRDNWNRSIHRFWRSSRNIWTRRHTNWICIRGHAGL